YTYMIQQHNPHYTTQVLFPDFVFKQQLPTHLCWLYYTRQDPPIENRKRIGGKKKDKRKQNVTKPILQGPCAFSWTCCTIWRVERERTRRATEGVPSPLAEP
ncbi:hypothetical protein PanWU01x14_025680, partial [Parasponia andersonii]